MSSSFMLADWRDLSRIINLLHRFGCTLEKLDVQRSNDAFCASIEFHGSPDSMYRLTGQIHRVLDDAKEMSA
jgi:hypothetical protein